MLKRGSGLGIKYLLLALKQFIGEKQLFYLLKAKAVDGVGKALANYALISKKEDSLFYYAENFLFAGEYLAERNTVSGLFAPASANIYLKAVGAFFFNRVERAFAYAASAVVADSSVNGDFSVDKLGCLHRAGSFYLAFFAALAGVNVDVGNVLTDDAEVVEVGLYAVIGAASAGNFEFVGQLDLTVAEIEEIMDLFAESEGIVSAVLAGSALAGNYRADFGAGAAGGKSCLSNILLKSGDVVKMYAGDLDGETGGKLHLAAAVFLGSLGNHDSLIGGYLAVAGYYSAVKAIGALVVKKAVTLDAFYLFGSKCAGHDHSPF